MTTDREQARVEVMRALEADARWREAIASVSLSHRADCRCLVCRAAAGDESAYVTIRVEALHHARRN